MKERKSNLDERQEQALLKIEHNGCWLAFWGLLIAMVVQLIVYGFDMKLLAGEWIVFMALCLYIWSSCLKQGIWDRQLKPDRKTNLLASLVAGLAFGALMFFSNWKNFPDKPLGVAPLSEPGGRSVRLPQPLPALLAGAYAEPAHGAGGGRLDRGALQAVL